MGAEPEAQAYWRQMQHLADRLESPHADKVYVAKDFTKAQLIAELRRSFPLADGAN